MVILPDGGDTMEKRAFYSIIWLLFKKAEKWECVSELVQKTMQL